MDAVFVQQRCVLWQVNCCITFCEINRCIARSGGTLQVSFQLVSLLLKKMTTLLRKQYLLCQPGRQLPHALALCCPLPQAAVDLCLGFCTLLHKLGVGKMVADQPAGAHKGTSTFISPVPHAQQSELTPNGKYFSIDSLSASKH